MTDMTGTAPEPRSIRRIDTHSAAARARIKGRYAAERRYRGYGLAALGITTLFLLVLLSSILWNGLPGFFQNYFVIDVRLDAAALDPTGKADEASLRAADYTGLARAALSESIPGITGRQAKKDLNAVLSSGAGDVLRKDVTANPSLVGQTYKARFVLSDDADIFLKGKATPIRTRMAAGGSANVSGTNGEVTITTSTSEFSAELAEVKSDLRARAAALADRADRQSQRGASKESVTPLREEAASLAARASDAASEEALSSDMPSLLVSMNGGMVKVRKLAANVVTGDVILPLSSTEAAPAGTWQVVTYETPEASRNVNDRTVTYLERLKALGKIENTFNWAFFTSGDSREPELAGIRGAIVGSILTLLVTLGLCLPIGVLAAIYLEEFAPRNRLTDLIEININNLAAVPSIVFGLLGLAVFLNFFGLPRSAPIVGGLVLALLVLPTIIIASRAALKAVPPSIREAALGIGASKQQAIFHHVLPLAMPGIMTGSIIGMAHALGETAPLLMIGMIAFIVDVPQTLTDAATVLPVQIYLWSDLPEPAFQAKTAAAIIVLLGVLFLMNGTAIWLRRKFERRW